MRLSIREYLLQKYRENVNEYSKTRELIDKAMYLEKYQFIYLPDLITK